MATTEPAAPGRAAAEARTALVLYWSHSGNTQKVAFSIQAGLEAGGLSVTMARLGRAGAGAETDGSTGAGAADADGAAVRRGAAASDAAATDADGLDFFAYDLVCLGFPSYQWHPPKAVDDYLKARFAAYRKEGRIRPCAPTAPGKNALVFCTYSGPHTGVREAIPAGKYAGQFFEHLGFTVVDEWYVLAEFHGNEVLSTQGRMGDVRGLPSEQDLVRIREQARLLAGRLPAPPLPAPRSLAPRSPAD
ncbi:MAG: flavodoxin family protein [Thermoleophilia bacterium]|nr:flavodoxin family protein [Thermoleophilia bacterium]